MKLTVREIVVFGMLGALMFVSKLLMDALPNIHLLATLTVVYTVVYRKKALYPIYIYVLLLGLVNGFSLWWIPHLYLWTILWGVVMLLPKTMSRRTSAIVYAIVCAMHGFLYGTLYAPFQALAYGLSFSAMITWIVAGLEFDLIHGIGNLVMSILILPMADVFRILEKQKMS